MRGTAGLVASTAVVATMLGCGGDSGAAESDGEVTVAAAVSLTEAFEAYAEETPAHERFSFAGSDELAAQIRQGAAPDVYAAADTELPAALHREGLVEAPEVLATNTLVLAVPAGSEIASLHDLEAPGLDLVIGTEAVPFGSYAREVLGRLPAAEREAILANVRSEESDVRAAVGKLLQGAADASLVYATDVRAAGGDLEAVDLPARLRPEVAYGIAVVRGGDDPEGARRFVDGLLEGEGTRMLEAAGFGSPPAPRP